MSYAKRHNAIVLQAADLLDTSRSWSLHSKIVEVMNKYRSVKFFSIYGQHDLYMRSEQSKFATSLGVLIQSGYIHLLGEEPYSIDDVDIYGCSWGYKVPVPSCKKGKINVLVIHANIGASALYPGHEFTKANAFLKKHWYYDLILCADIHQKFIYQIDDRYILNTGPMMRLEATKYNLDHQPCFAVIDSNEWKLEWVYIPCEPAEAIMSRSHIEAREQSANMLKEFTHMVKNAEFSGVDFFKNLEDYIKKNRVRKQVAKKIGAVIESSMSKKDK